MFHRDLELIARAIADEADQVGAGVFIVAPKRISYLRRLLADRPPIHTRALLDTARGVIFAGIRDMAHENASHGFNQNEATAQVCIDAITELVNAEVEYALADVGAMTSRDAFFAMFETEAEALALQTVVLRWPDAELPDAARAVRDGGPAVPLYWTWLGEIAGAGGRGGFGTGAPYAGAGAPAEGACGPSGLAEEEKGDQWDESRLRALQEVKP